MLHIETADRPGLLLEIIQIITDVNVDVESAEIDTEVLSLSLSFSVSVSLLCALLSCLINLSSVFQGLVAKDKFHVSYRGAALSPSLSQVTGWLPGLVVLSMNHFCVSINFHFS